VDSQRTLLKDLGRDGSARRSVDAGEAPTRRASGPAARTRIIARRGAASPWPDEGHLLQDRYLLEERLGAGGFGVVWRAHDQLLGRDVALKRVWLGADGDSERATREAQASARLSHPAIVALYEAFALDDAFYLVSELVDGDTLARLIADIDIEDEQVLEIGIALSGALAHAHARGVVHRDIKPQNVLVPAHSGDARSAAKLTDFGGAALTGEDALTRTGDVLGTLAYMAPEQTEAEPVTEQADLYSLALVLYEAFAGTNPVRGPTPAATARRIGRRLEPLARTRRDLDRGLCEAIDCALVRAPDRRGDVAELEEALRDALEHGSHRSRWRRLSGEATRRQPRLPAAPSSHPASERLLDEDPGDREDRAHEEFSVPPSGAEGPEQHAERRRRKRGRTVAVVPVASGPRAPRGLLWVAALAGAVWELAHGRSGLALVMLAALAPLLIAPAERGTHSVGGRWLLALLAPVLGLAGLAGAFPALAGQARGWGFRAALAALGYWFTVLAEPLLDRRLWLGPPAGAPPRSVWEHSAGTAVTHVISPALSLGVLLGASLWAAAAALLPWIVRGRSAAADGIAAASWCLGLVLLSPALGAGLHGGLSHPSPRGAPLGAALGGLLAVGARALRGPVSVRGSD
jgi:serine/threonine protein kinase